MSDERFGGGRPVTRRCFFVGTMAAAGAAAGSSLEEQALAAGGGEGGATAAKGAMPTGKIGNLNISRLICGGNLISGHAHSRDLVYVSPLLKNYFSDEKVWATWRMCEEHGINTMICNPRDERAVRLFREYRDKLGGKIQWLAQVAPDPEDLKGVVTRAMDSGASAIFLLGNLGDRWVFDGKVDLIDRLVKLIKERGVPAGVAGHSIETPLACEDAGIPVDFYMKTFHRTDYWSTRRPDQHKEVIDNYSTDNYWDMEPDKTIAEMGKIQKPWIAYKVLAAGAIRPGKGFDHAFAHGADFACVGMFDFQIAEDAAIARDAVAKHAKRSRAWMA